MLGPCLHLSHMFTLQLYQTSRTIATVMITENTGTPGGSVLHVNIEQVDFLAENLTFPAVDDLRKTFTLPDNSNNTEPLYHSDSFLFCFCTNDGTKLTRVNWTKEKAEQL